MANVATVASVVIAVIIYLTISAYCMPSSVFICVDYDSYAILAPASDSYQYITGIEIKDVCIDHFNNTDSEWMTNYNHSSIVCTSNHSCSIVCLESNACQSVPIYCDEDTQCHVYCTANESCASSIIDASHSSLLALHCDGYHSCQDIHIYCPLDSTASNCYIQGSDHASHVSLHIYSTNGWDGIDLSQYATSIQLSNDNRMFCIDLENNGSCVISSLEWNCVDHRNNNNSCFSTHEPHWATFEYSSTNDEPQIFNSTTPAPDQNTAVYIGSGVVAFLVIVALCCLFLCAQYRRKQESVHQLEKKESTKKQLYGVDGLDETLYVGADETTQFKKSVYGTDDTCAGTSTIQEQKTVYVEPHKSGSSESDLEDEFNL